MVDGKPIKESMAISRFAAKKAGLIPEDDYEAACCDALAVLITGILSEIEEYSQIL